MAPPIATVSDDQTPRTQFTADGIQRDFVVTWPIRSLGELHIIFGEDDEPDLAYNVTGVDDDAGITIAFDFPPPNGTVITVWREGLLERTANYGQETEFNAATVNAEWIDVYLRLQELRGEGRRSVTRALADPATDRLRMPVPQASQIIAWNEDGTALVNVPLPGVAEEEPNNDTAVYPADIGLSTAPGFDNSPLLISRWLAMSFAGGGEFIGDGTAYPCLTNLYVPSFVTVRRLKLQLGPTVTFAIAGSKRAAYSGLRLVSAAAAADTTMVWDAAPVGGGTLSSLMNVGSPFSIVDGANQESGTITAINDGTRTVTISTGGTGGGLQYAYTVAGATITIEACARLSSNSVLLSDEVTVEDADVAQLSEGDWVQIEDDRREGGATIYVEQAQIVGIASTTVSLSRQLRRVYLTASHARLTLIDPARSAAVLGCAVECIGTPNATRFDPLFEIRYALDCIMSDCIYGGTDTVGRRGNMFRIHKSYGCSIVSSTGRNPLYTEEGAGNIGAIAYSTQCWFINLYAQGARHGGQLIAATESGFIDGSSIDTLLTGFEAHGLNSVGCYIRAKAVTFASRTASASNIALVLGNATWQSGDHSCTIEAPNLGPFKGNSGVAVARVFTPCTNPVLKNIHASDVQKFVIHRDTSGAGTLVVDGLAVIDCSVRGCADRAFDFQGKANGGSVNSLTSARISGFRGEGLYRGGLFYDITGLVIKDSSFEGYAVDAVTEPYCLAFKRIDGLVVDNVDGLSFHRGIDIQDCDPALFLKTDMLGLGFDEFLKDRGGSVITLRGCNGFLADGSDGVTITSGGSTIVAKAVGNVGTEASSAVAMSATDRYLGRFSPGAGDAEEGVISDNAQSLLAAADYAAMRVLLGLVLGTNAQAYDADLTAIAALASAADKLPYATGAQAWALTTLTSFMRTVLDDVDAATARATLGVTIGTNVQAYDADLSAIAALTSAADKLPYSTGAQAWALTDLSSFSRTVLDDTTAVNWLTTLGLKNTTLQIPFSGGGVTIAVGTKLYIQVPWSVTVTGWRLVSGSGAGSIVIDIWKDTFANFPPSVAETVTGSEKPTLTAAESAEDLSLTTWTDVSWDAEEWLVFNVDSCSGISLCTLVLQVSRR